MPIQMVGGDVQNCSDVRGMLQVLKLKTGYLQKYRLVRMIQGLLKNWFPVIPARN